MGIIDTSSDLHLYCVQFCYLNLLQQELFTIMKLWNTHHIRRTQSMMSPNGKPDVMYYMPEIYGAQDHIQPADANDVEFLSGLLTRDIPECNDNAKELFTILLHEGGKDLTTSMEEADDLLVYLLDTTENYLNDA